MGHLHKSLDLCKYPTENCAEREGHSSNFFDDLRELEGFCANPF